MSFGKRSPDMRILIVEDEARLARHISSALIEAGHDPAIVQDGETAIGRAQESAFDLLLLDVMLPGMDGFEVLRRLREAGTMARVLMLTARGEVNDRVNGLQMGADDYLSKPFAMQELVARVRAWSQIHGRTKTDVARGQFDFAPGRSAGAARRAGNRTFKPRTDIIEGFDARAGTSLYADGAVRAGVAT